ncbi:MAG: PEP-CTERM sorting domain-containing protein [Lentimonas sp.]
MKKLNLTIISLVALTASASALTLSGTASTSVSVANGNSSFLIVDTDDNGLSFDANSAGVTFSEGSFLGSSDDLVVAYNPIAGFFGSSVPGNANFTLDDNGINAGDDFFIVFFGGSISGGTVTTTGGDTFGILDGSDWEVGSNNAATLSFGSDYQQFTSASADSTIVPEPSSYAALAGLLALAWVSVRRRG